MVAHSNHCDAEKRYGRLIVLLERVPPTQAACELRSAILRLGEVALARNDFGQLQKLHGEATVLVHALGGVAGDAPISYHPKLNASDVVRPEAGPGNPRRAGPPQPQRSSSWRCEHGVDPLSRRGRVLGVHAA